MCSSVHVLCFQTSERMDADIDRLSVFLALWNEINSIANDIECWSVTSVSELSEGALTLLSSPDMEERLDRFKVSGKTEQTRPRNHMLRMRKG